MNSLIIKLRDPFLIYPASNTNKKMERKDIGLSKMTSVEGGYDITTQDLAGKNMTRNTIYYVQN